jgi:hypothetical protein
MKHYLIAADEALVKEFETFNAVEIKKAIIQYLTENPSGMVTHEKECKGEFNDVINCYENNPKTGEPSRIIEKGNKTFYIALT